MMHGKGTYTYISGASYEGEFEDGYMCGYGVFHYKNGSVYEGYFRDDKRHGEGKLVFSEVDIYHSLDDITADELKTGELKDKEPPKKPNVYEGNWREGLMHGKGVYTFSTGAVYDGDFRFGIMHGRGKCKLTYGDYYEGQYKDGKEHGIGVYRYANGSVYEGKHYMTMCAIYVENELIVGEFKDGLMHGRGIFKYTNGDIYEGEFQGDVRHGPGVHKDKFGNQIDQMWKNGQRVQLQAL